MKVLETSLGLLLAAGQPGAAQEPLACRFDTVCFMQEPCEASRWAMRFAPHGTEFVLESNGGRRLFDALGRDGDDSAFVSAPDGGSVAMLTIADDGAAIYAEQSMSGGFAVIEYGNCRKDIP